MGSNSGEQNPVVEGFMNEISATRLKGINRG